MLKCTDRVNPEASSVAKSIPSYLKLHREALPEPEPTLAELPLIRRLCQSFTQATGWSLAYRSTGDVDPNAAWSAPVRLDVGLRGGSSANGRLVLEGTAPGASSAPTAESLDQARELATSVAEVLGELQQTRRALWEREADLAAGIPVSPRGDEQQHLAERLEAVLRGGAEAVGCEAAAAYLLDEGTSQLKLRAAWGLPPDRFLRPGRPLRGATADLEALVGHAVVLEDTKLLPHWRSPEDFPTAVCVPISTPTNPLGTLWVFSRHRRDFSEHQTNLLEVVAGRLAAELERAALLNQGLVARQLDRQLDAAARWQASRLPTIAPLLDHWQVAGWTEQGDQIGGDWHDWSVLPDGALAVAVGHGDGTRLESGLTAAALHSAFRSHASYRHTAEQMIQRINDTFWSSSSGAPFASLFYSVIQPETGEAECCSAGNGGALLLRRSGNVVLTQNMLPLGTQPENSYRSLKSKIQPGETLVVFSPGVRGLLDGSGKPWDERRIATAVPSAVRTCHAAKLLEGIVAALPEATGAVPDRTILVVKRS